MWPFKSLQERIDALEDAQAGMRAKLTALIAATKNAESLPAIYVQMSLDLNSKIAVNESRLKRLKSQKLKAEI